MNSVTVGDLAKTYSMQRQVASVKLRIETLSKEMGDGVAADLSKKLSGDFSQIAGIERSILLLESYETANKEAAFISEAVQISLDQVSSLIKDALPGLLNSTGGGTDEMMQATIIDARSKFSKVVSTLNTEVAGRHVFSGAAVDNPALADADVLLTELRKLIAAETTSADAIAAIDDWFNSNDGGFQTSGYTGSKKAFSAFTVSQGERLSISVKADHQSIRDALRGFATVVLASDATFANDDTEKAAMLSKGLELLTKAQSGLNHLKADVGVVQAGIDQASTRNAAEKTALEIARSTLIKVDDVETATALRSAESQLEALYAITARTSRLSFMDFLR